jgi:hypothetical protein
MDLYSRSLEFIEKNAEIKRSGKFNGIPYPYERLRQFMPSIDKESVIGITSYTGAGKSKFARYNFVLHPYEFSLHNDYPIQIDYYALEDSANKIFLNILCNYLYMKHNIKIGLWDLQSKFKELPSAITAKIKEGEKYLQDFNNKVRIIDSTSNPYGIYKDVLKKASELGEIITEEKDWNNGDKVNKVNQIVGYKPKGETHHILLCDNLNNIDKEKHHHDKKEAMDNFVQKDCRMLYSKIFKMTCVIIHQQALEAERQQFTNTGGSIIEKIKPSLANLGGTKEVVRSYHLVFSLFNTHKFKIPNYKGYDTNLIGNNFRELEILKSNDGFDNISVPLYFDGAAEYFRELPHSDTQKEELQKFYKWLEQDRLAQKNKFLLF